MNPTEQQLKQSLLLTHGTIYGYVPEIVPWEDFGGKSTSFIRAETVPWRTELPYVCASEPHDYAGPMTDTTPIDVVSWAAGPGAINITGLEIWQQCLTLFLRHI